MIASILLKQSSPFCAQAALALASGTEVLVYLRDRLFSLKGEIWFPQGSGGYSIVEGASESFRDLCIAIAALDLEIERRGNNRQHQHSTVENLAISLGWSKDRADKLFASLFGAQDRATFRD